LNESKVYVLNINLCIKYLKPIPYIRFNNILYNARNFFLIEIPRFISKFNSFFFELRVEFNNCRDNEMKLGASY